MDFLYGSILHDFLGEGNSNCGGSDGRNRYLACKMVGTEPRYEAYEGNDPVGHCIKLNVERRQLNRSQLACAAVNCVELTERLAAEARERQEAQGGHGKMGGRGNRKTLVEQIPQEFSGSNDAQTTGRTRDQLAEMFETNAHYISDARKLKNEAPDSRTKRPTCLIRWSSGS